MVIWAPGPIYCWIFFGEKEKCSSIGVGASFWLILATDLVNQSGVIAYIVGALVYSILTGLVLSALLATTNQSQANLAEAS